MQEVYRNRDREEIADREQVSIYTEIQGGFEISEVGSYGRVVSCIEIVGGSDKMGTCLVSHRGGLSEQHQPLQFLLGKSTCRRRKERKKKRRKEGLFLG